MKLTPTPISSKCFTYIPSTTRFVAEASPLRGYDFLARLYDDSADRGFIMVSSKTGKTMVFAYVSTLHSMEEFDGELEGWYFEGIETESGVAYSCMIFND